jgi:uncharacterized membrane protein
VLLIVGVLAGTFIVYPQLPPVVSTVGPKWRLLVDMPTLMALMLGLFWLLASISRKRFPVENFARTYYFVMLVIMALFAYFQILMLWAALAHVRNQNAWIMGGIFVTLGLLGNVMGRTRRNLLMGLRVPWALAGERAWNAGSRRAGQIMVIAALVGLVLTLAGANTWILLGVIVLAILVLNIYSLVSYKRLQHENKS